MIKILIIMTRAGLGNRLQEILSHRLYALENGYNNIYFYWSDTEHCSCKNIEHFIEKIQDVTIIHSGNYKNKDLFSQMVYNKITSNNEIRNKVNSSSVNYEKRIINNDENKIELTIVGGCGPNLNFLNCEPNIIQFSDYIEQKVSNFIKEFLSNKYIAIHLRLQDNNLYVDYDVINNFILEYPEYKVYLATDSTHKQNEYMNKYNNIVTNKNISVSFHKNRSNIEDAIFDMLICRNAFAFCGTSNDGNCRSSFSNIIYGLRERGGYEKATKNNKNHIISVIQK